jgi:hypothetical protein
MVFKEMGGEGGEIVARGLVSTRVQVYEKEKGLRKIE